jgi:hypothetical protein
MANNKTKKISVERYIKFLNEFSRFQGNKRKLEKIVIKKNIVL